ncbi:MAG: PilZ domain-containing protein [Candidatus Paceibacterota bacterium]
MASRQERRKYIRIDSRYVVRCERKTLTPSETSRSVEAFTKNVSAEGMLFTSDFRYAVGDSLKVDLKLPGWKSFASGLALEGFSPAGDSQSMTGLVTRVELLGDKTFDIGVHFTGTDKKVRWALMKYIYDFSGDEKNKRGN